MEISGITKLTDNKWVNLFEIAYLDNDGDDNRWFMASRRQQPVPGVVTNLADAVVVVPWHVKEQKLVLLREFRVILNGWQYAFPAGLVDEGETLETTARRELWEETGLTLTRIIKASPPLYSSAGLTDETISLIFAECDGVPVRLKERSEEAESVLISQSAAQELLQEAGAAFDVRAWLCLSFFAENGPGGII